MNRLLVLGVIARAISLQVSRRAAPCVVQASTATSLELLRARYALRASGALVSLRAAA